MKYPKNYQIDTHQTTSGWKIFSHSTLSSHNMYIF